MDVSDALRMNELTRAFYEQNASSFSETRGRAWPGWERVLDAIDLPERPRVLDVGCGNLRFERFVREVRPQARFACVDSCAALAADACMPDTAFIQADIITALADDALARAIGTGGTRVDTAATLADDTQIGTGSMQADIAATLADGTLARAIGTGGFDLCVAFGFMHHIPLRVWRERLMRDLVAMARPGGFVAVAFWRFLNSARLIEKACAATEAGRAHRGIVFDDPCDRLLGWQDEPDTFRYCHHFTESEIDALAAAAPGAHEIARFSADGAEQLNRYLILQRSATSTR